MAEAKPQSQQDTPEGNKRGWTTEPVGDNATMKDVSHKEYEARDTAPVKDPGPGGGEPPPDGTGESITRRGEDVHKQDGKDFEDTGENQVGRPIGKSNPEDIGIAGQKPIDKDSPELQHP